MSFINKLFGNKENGITNKSKIMSHKVEPNNNDVVFNNSNTTEIQEDETKKDDNLMNNNENIDNQSEVTDETSEEYEDPDYTNTYSPTFDVKYFFYDKENNKESTYVRGNLEIEDDIRNHKIIFNEVCLTDNVSNCPISVDCTNKIGDDYYIKIEGLPNCYIFLPIYFMLDEDTLIKLMLVYDDINSLINKRINKFCDEYMNYVSNLKSNAAIYLMCYNFLKTRNNIHLFNIEHTISLEIRLLRAGQIGLKTLMVPIEEYASFELNDEIEGDSLIFVNEIFNLLDILKSKDKFPFEYDAKYINYPKSLFILWKLLREIAIDYFSDEYLKENNLKVEEFMDINLFDCLTYHLNNCLDNQSERSLASFTYLMMRINLLNSRDFYKNYDYVLSVTRNILNQMKLKNMEQELLNNYSTDIQTLIDDVDLMSGFEFETLIGKLFGKLGFTTEITKASGDQGIDIIAEKNSRKIGIQAKCYSGSVGNKAIQEVVAGLNYYHLDKGLVITNNYFTESARELAEANNVILWDRTILKEKLSELQIEQ